MYFLFARITILIQLLINSQLCDTIIMDIIFKSLVSYTDQGTNQAAFQTNQAEDNSVAARILKVIEAEPMLSQKKIADIIGEKYSTVKYYMESMKKSGIIKREGSSQKGKWIIL